MARLATNGISSAHPSIVHGYQTRKRRGTFPGHPQRSSSEQQAATVDRAHTPAASSAPAPAPAPALAPALPTAHAPSASSASSPSPALAPVPPAVPRPPQPKQAAGIDTDRLREIIEEEELRQLSLIERLMYLSLLTFLHLLDSIYVWKRSHHKGSPTALLVLGLLSIWSGNHAEGAKDDGLKYDPEGLESELANRLYRWIVWGGKSAVITGSGVFGMGVAIVVATVYSSH
ncbi:hypothetical protein I302_101206 [Kwoniella bestiolae CBS 10118]|uniref:Uncharacterized protein n=1 Tax=Kwoniella bestiolae CBS 10118 TaxID=1296100 RepID=A0A1B9G780_9TREE|nr:hypothetical protein I302_04579 [Kwoniella bestiolae CBS 10118]OCF26889.1 hypothetical protein I302_04579 [Kwoniella bestiolae CBS 10118]